MVLSFSFVSHMSTPRVDFPYGVFCEEIRDACTNFVLFYPLFTLWRWGKLMPRIFFIKLLYMKHKISLAAHSCYWFVYLCIYWKVSVEVMGLCIVKTFQVLMSWWDSILQAHSWWLQQYSRYILQDIVSESYISLRLDVKAISCRWIVKKKVPSFFLNPFPWS